MVRDRQNRRSETLPSLPPPVRRRLHLCHAHQRVRSGRQLSSRERPRHSCANPTRSCGEAIGAPTVNVWGAGTPRREFIFVDDLGDACVFVLEQYSGESPLNVGTGEDITIADLARLIAQVIGYRGELVFDMSRPDGTPRKLLNMSKLRALGWKAHTSLAIGLERSYADFLSRHGRHQK
jgi:dTDP-D-glucose 4,6-dehydratase